MLSINSVLALLILLLISSGLFFFSKKVKVPYTVMLVLVGLLIVPLTQIPILKDVFGFLGEVKLTPELLFYIFLPMLIFESGFNMNVRKMIDNSWPILFLAVFGLLVSTFGIALALFYIFPVFGIEIPFIAALLFGAIISSTDPVAVLALFKEFGAPKRLTMIFEGESLFNDGTAVALFMVLLGIASHGFSGAGTIIEGVGMFAGMVFFGILFGLIMAAFFSWMLRITKSNEFVAVTVLMISAHVVFVISELINHEGLFGLPVHVSPIIATTIASLFLGNYSRHILTPRTDEYLGKFIEHMAFIANSLVFILAGILFASSNIDISTLWLPILVTVLIVMILRAISVFAVTAPINILKLGESIPRSWQILLSWGSLRGALAIIIVLLIPADLKIEGWNMEYSPRDFILALTTGCILATLFIKAPLMGTFMRKLKIDQPDPIEEVHAADMGMYYLLTERERLDIHKTKGFVSDKEYKSVVKHVENKIKQAKKDRQAMLKEYGDLVFEQALHLTAIDIEKNVLKQLFINQEVSERVFRRINGKLRLQSEQIEAANVNNINESKHTDQKDVFDQMVNVITRPIESRRKLTPEEEKLQYYRAQMIMARKAVKVLDTMQSQYSEGVFIDSVFDKIREKYQTYRRQAASSMEGILTENKNSLEGYLAKLAQRSVRASGGRALEFLHTKGLATESLEEEIEHKYAIKW